MLKCTDDVTSLLDSALERVHEPEGELVLDFSAVQRVDPRVVRALEQLAARAGENGKRVVLEGVNAEVYKVLKLAKLGSHFQFVG